MKVTSKQLVYVVTDVLCDVCGESTSQNGQHSPQFGMLQAEWGYGSPMTASLIKSISAKAAFSQPWLT